MTFLSGPRGLSMIAALWSFSAHAAQLPSADENSIKLDGIIESIKKEAVDFNREAQDIEQTVLYPDHKRVSIYISCQVSKLLLQNVTLTVDDGQPVRYDYSERDAKALLLSDGLHRLLLTTAEPGSHRIRAEFRGQFADADKTDPPVVGSFETTFEKTRRPSELELRVARGSRLAKPQMNLILWKTRSGDEPNPDPKSQTRKRRVRR